MFPAKSPLPEWIVKLAWRIHDLIGDAEVLKRFRERVDHWIAREDQERNHLFEWEERRNEHFKAIKAKRRLLSQKLGPPEKGWQWGSEHVPARSRLPKIPGKIRTTEVRHGWTPPELLDDAKPRLRRYPLELAHDAPFDELEKFTVLAAIHDRVVTHVERIKPEKTCVPYNDLIHLVDSLSDEKRDALTAVLRSVKAQSDSAATPPKGSSKKGNTKGKQGRPSNTDHKRDAQWTAAWQSGEHDDKSDCASKLGTTVKELNRALDRQRHRKNNSE